MFCLLFSLASHVISRDDLIFPNTAANKFSDPAPPGGFYAQQKINSSFSKKGDQNYKRTTWVKNQMNPSHQTAAFSSKIINLHHCTSVHPNMNKIDPVSFHIFYNNFSILQTFIEAPLNIYLDNI